MIGQIRCAEVLLTAFLLAATPARAHAVTPDGGWGLDAWLVALLLFLTVVCYACGAVRLRHGGRRRGGLRTAHVLAFLTGWGALVLALLSPLDAWSKALFSAHMVQHELLMLIAAPLLVAGKPLAVAAWAFRSGRSGIFAVAVRAVRRSRLWRALESPLCAWSLHLLVVWLWHAPRLFQAGLGSDWIHAVQHASFLFSALLFWWALQRRSGNGLAVLYLLTTAIHTGILGALLTFAPQPLYPAYLYTTAAWGMTPLEDQQLGGLIMWVPAGLILLATAMILFAKWLAATERRALAPQRSVRT
jgi:putative membrane protein